jgi:dimethylhistidine N-methyltransferase
MRSHLLTGATVNHRAEFARDVRHGLRQTPKALSCRFFYDAEGSRLFEAICALPEYYLTRAERAILRNHADSIVAACPPAVTLVELGSGSAVKTRWLIEALLRRQPNLRYVPIDISPTALTDSTQQLVDDYPQLEVAAIAAEYREGLRQLPTAAPGPKLVLWLGSNVGNFDRVEATNFLREVRQALTTDDRLLLGIDLRKDASILERAYDDRQGVTATFNLNLLARINRDLGGHFDLGAFRHRAVWNDTAGRVEMYLVSTGKQRVRIDALEMEVAFAEGEAIHTENSYKYSPEEIAALAKAIDCSIMGRWTDAEGRFSENLLAPIQVE